MTSDSTLQVVLTDMDPAVLRIAAGNTRLNGLQPGGLTGSAGSSTAHSQQSHAALGGSDSSLCSLPVQAGDGSTAHEQVGILLADSQCTNPQCSAGLSAERPSEHRLVLHIAACARASGCCSLVPTCGMMSRRWIQTMQTLQMSGST